MIFIHALLLADLRFLMLLCFALGMHIIHINIHNIYSTQYNAKCCGFFLSYLQYLYWFTFRLYFVDAWLFFHCIALLIFVLFYFSHLVIFFQGKPISRHVPGSQPPFPSIPDPDQNKEDTSFISAVAYGVYIPLSRPI